MSEDIVVPMADLRTALTRVLDAVESEFGPTVRVPWDYYWHLWADAAFDPFQDPPAERLTMGQISDDVEEVQGFVARDPEEDTYSIWHDLLHIIGLLRALERLATP